MENVFGDDGLGDADGIVFLSGEGDIFFQAYSWVWGDFLSAFHGVVSFDVASDSKGTLEKGEDEKEDFTFG